MGVSATRRQPEPLTASGIVALNLRRARELRGLSQAEAGELLGEYLPKSWSAASFSAAERSWERGPERSFTANELDAFSRAFKLPVLWFLLPPPREEARGRPLPRAWVQRLLWSESTELLDHAQELAADRRAASLLGVIDAGEDALVEALAKYRAGKLSGLARQLREVARTLESGAKKRRR